ncbi:MAG: DUF5666 domain-containing protein [Candidatus Moranbacteria bacterium]|nr:DUF5666 domain-containing protein [Candidatus Moranbacteria bacterium]
MNELLKSKKFKLVAVLLGFVLVALVSFAGGVGVGLHKARFSYNFGENYERNFVGRPFPGGPESDMMRGEGPVGMMRDFEGRGFRNGHGIAGTIVSVADNKIVLKDPDGQENSVTVNEKTLIKRGQDTISVNDLKNDDRIVVMGRPGDDGTVNADLIRVFDNNMDNNSQN